MPGPAPPLVNGLQIDQAPGFQQRFHVIQRIAWSVLALVPVAAVAGAVGGGLFSETTTSGAAGVTVTYDRFARITADTEIELGTALFAVQPDAVASSSGTVTFAGGTPVRVDQFVFP